MQTIKTLFTLWNTEYFDGKLTVVSLGFYSRRSNTKGFFRRQHGMKSIHINTLDERPESMQFTLLHEMVHAYLSVCNVPCGHTPMFKALLKRYTLKAFGFYPTENVSHVIHVPNQALALTTATKQVPSIPLPTITRTYDGNGIMVSKTTETVPLIPFLSLKTSVTETVTRYKVLSSGEVGTFLKESYVYGKKHITLQLPSKMFPFITALENVVPA